MQTLNLGITMNQGDDFNLVIGINGDSGPIDISAYAFKGQMRVSTDPTSEVVAEFEFTILPQTGSTLGQVQWSLPNTDTTELDTSTAYPLTDCRQTTPYVFDVKMQDSIGQVSRIIQGLIFVSPQVTMESF